MARPIKSRTDKKEKIIMLRLTDLEYDNISTNARRTGYSMSEYIRRQVFSGNVPVIVNISVSLEELQNLTREFAAIGNNLNQIAKHFNMGGIRSKEMQDRINSCLDAIMEMRKDVARLAEGMYGNFKTLGK